MRVGELVLKWMLRCFLERKMPDKKYDDDTTRTLGELDMPANFESILPDYPVKVADFNGPLDLLIHLIKKNQVDIYDIPVVLITNQYLEYLELMRELNLDVAGEFLVMSATLIHIKSRTLVPRLETESVDDLEEEDPRDALVKRLVEHQRFKMAAELLHERETVRSAQWTRPDGLIEESLANRLSVSLRSIRLVCCRLFSPYLKDLVSTQRFNCHPRLFQLKLGFRNSWINWLPEGLAGSMTYSQMHRPASN